MFKFLWPWSNRYSLSKSLFSLSNKDKFTIGQAVEGILIVGATGSGKSSGSGKVIAHSFLKAGFGGLVLCAKADERRLWESYCRKAGRSGDLIIFGPEHKYRFNFIDYELNRKGGGAGLTENLINLFSTVLEIAERGQGGGKEGEEYWKRANRQLCRNLVDLLIMAKGKISIPDLYRLAVSAPTSMEQIRSNEWKQRSFCFQCLGEADKRKKTARQKSDFELVADYYMLEFPGLSDKTRSVIVSTFTSMIDVLNRGLLRELFCGNTNITPEAIAKGKIILVDLAVKEFAEVGQFAQILWKYAFQRSIERRDVRKSPRPVFLWQDEGQNFITSYDMQFQATCRSAKVSTVVLTQNVNNFYATMGEGQKGRAQVDSLFSNLNLKIFHSNADYATNEYASTLIGKTRQYMSNANTNYQAGDWFSTFLGNGPSNASAGVSEQIQFEVEPSTFTQLRTGGPPNKWIVDAIIFSNGTRFKATGRPWMHVAFSQK